MTSALLTCLHMSAHAAVLSSVLPLWGARFKYCAAFSRSTRPHKALRLQRTGEVSYNGALLKEFIPERTSAYVTQYDDVRPASRCGSLSWPQLTQLS